MAACPAVSTNLIAGFSPLAASSAFLTVSCGTFTQWIGCMFGELQSIHVSYVGWCLYTCMAAIITYVRMKAREAYNGTCVRVLAFQEQSRPSYCALSWCLCTRQWVF